MKKKVIILLSTYNGEKYLKEQLDSILNQTYKNIFVFVRDDGSNDKTCEILEEYSSKDSLKWCSGQNVGFALSFMQLLYDAPNADYYAFCDQDDIWHPDKIEVAVSMLERLDLKKPLLYTSNQTYVDNNGNELGTRFNINPSTHFEERFMRGYFSGCTMVFNNVLRNFIIKEKSRVPDQFIKSRWHDTWTLLICLAIGEVIYDPISHIDYRRHDTNTSQAEGTKISRYFKGMSSMVKDTSRKNLRSKTANMLIELYQDILIEEKKLFLQCISNYKRCWSSRIKLAFDNSIVLTKPESRLEFALKVLLGWI